MLCNLCCFEALGPLLVFSPPFFFQHLPRKPLAGVFLELQLFAISAYLLEMLLFLFSEQLVYTRTGGGDLSPVLSDTVTAQPDYLEGYDFPIFAQI